MKTARLFVLALIAAAGSLSGQTIQFVTVGWQRSVDQKNATSVQDAGATPYSFQASVSGTSGSPVTGSTFSSVTVGLTNNSVGPSLTFNVTDKEWQFNASYATDGAMLTAYPSSGAVPYVMNLYTATAANATGDKIISFAVVPSLSTSILQEPIVTLSGGSWQPNGTFLVNSVSSPVTLTFNNPYNATLGSPGTNSFHYDIWLSNVTSLSGGANEGFINRDASGAVVSSTVPQLTIAAGQLVDGNTYTLEVGYEQVMASSAILSNTAFSAALVGVRSKISIVTPLAAVPEPAADAVWFGVAAMAGVLVRRRRIA